MIRVREVRPPSRSRRVRDVLGKYTTDLLGQTILVLCTPSKQAYTYDDGTERSARDASGVLVSKRLRSRRLISVEGFAKGVGDDVCHGMVHGGWLPWNRLRSRWLVAVDGIARMFGEDVRHGIVRGSWLPWKRFLKAFAVVFAVEELRSR